MSEHRPSVEPHASEQPPSGGHRPSIEVFELTKAFGEVQALSGVSLSVGPGEVLGLLGPNGAGKTTLVRVIATLLLPDSGRVSVAGFDVVRDAGRVRACIGLAGQLAALDELLTGRENLQLVGRLYGLDADTSERRSVELLEQLGLTAAGGRRVATYSGGMRRRLDLGATLIGRPSVLLLDEPTSGLDPRSRGELWGLVDDIAAAGTSVLLTSQHLEEVERLASRIVVLDRGAVIAEGTPGELKRMVGGHVLEAQVERGPDLDIAERILASIGDGPTTVETASRRVAVPTGGSVGDLVTAAGELERCEVSVAELGLRLPLLDDVFLALTGAPTPTDDAADAGDSDPDVEAVDAAPRRDAVEPPAAAPEPSGRWWSDVVTVTGRYWTRRLRTPQLLFFSTVQPVLFVLALSAIFGELVENTAGGDYIGFLLPGVVVMNVVLAAGSTGVGLAEDMKAGIIDRFRSLPMARSAVLTGRTLTDLAGNAGAITLMILAGVLLGYRLEGSALEGVAALAVAMLFGYACTWLFAAIGLAVRDPQTAQFAGFAPVLPLVFLSSAWVPIETMSGAIEGFARHQPVNVTIEAVRSLSAGNPDWGVVWQSLAWSGVLLALFAVVATRQYTRATS